MIWALEKDTGDPCYLPLTGWSSLLFIIFYMCLAKSGSIGMQCMAERGSSFGDMAVGQMLSEELHTGLCRGCDKKEKETPYPEWGLIALWDQSGTVFEFVYFLLQLAQNSASYQKVAGAQYGISPLGLCIWTCDAPWRSFLFRGVIYNRIKSTSRVSLPCCWAGTCIRLLSRKPVQILYASLMGLAMALVCMKATEGSVHRSCSISVPMQLSIPRSKLGFFAGALRPCSVWSWYWGDLCFWPTGISREGTTKSVFGGKWYKKVRFLCILYNWHRFAAC